jgi:CheY-like chemotaxis protein
VKKHAPTILIVEDDLNDQFFINRALQKIGVTGPVHLVNNGLEAIAYMMGEGKFADRALFAYPTFVITDLKMPGADGFAVLDFFKANPEWAVIPTIVLSASSDLDDIKKSYMLGASSYHIKPSSPAALAQLLTVLHAYWLTCEVPEVDASGRQLHTNSNGKLGERFAQADQRKPAVKSRRMVQAPSAAGKH